MKIEVYNQSVYSNPYQKYASFGASRLNNVNVIAKKLELKKDIFEKRPLPVQDMYKNSIEFLNGRMLKDDYVTKLNEILNKINNSRSLKNNSSQKINLSPKEETFFENMFITFDNLEDKASLTKEQLAKSIAILTK